MKPVRMAPLFRAAGRLAARIAPRHVHSLAIGTRACLVPLILTVGMTACAGNPSTSSSMATPVNAQGLHQEIAWVYGCTDGSRFTARFDGNEVRLFLPGRSILFSRDPATSKSRYVRTMGNEEAVFQTSDTNATLHLPGQPDRSCSGVKGPGPWDLAQLAGVEFRAIGHQPDWVLEMGSQTGVTFMSESTGGRQAFPWGKPEQQGDSAVWNLRGHDDMLTVLIAKRACVDSLSDQSFQASVTVILGGKTFQGCGRLLSPPDK